MLTENDVQLLQEGDKLVLDAIAGARITGQGHSSGMASYLQRFGLNHGETYTFDRKESTYRQGTFLGWYIHVEEEKFDPKVPFQYYAVTPDLEAKLEERK